MFQQVYTGLLAQLADMPVYLRAALEQLPREALLKTAGSDDLHLLTHAWHVRDCESELYGARIRRILAEDKPTLPGLDVGAWPEERGYAARPLEQALAEFSALRATLVDDVASLSPEALARVGIRFDGQASSVLDVLGQLAEHDRDHRVRIAAILRSLVQAQA